MDFWVIVIVFVCVVVGSLLLLMLCNVGFDSDIVEDNFEIVFYCD